MKFYTFLLMMVVGFYANAQLINEMNLLLLKKVEERTLHLIGQEQKDGEQDKQINLLQTEIEKIKTKK